MKMRLVVAVVLFGVAPLFAMGDQDVAFWRAFVGNQISILDKEVSFPGYQMPQACHVVSSAKLQDLYVEGLQTIDACQQVAQAWGRSVDYYVVGRNDRHAGLLFSMFAQFIHGSDLPEDYEQASVQYLGDEQQLTAVNLLSLMRDDFKSRLDDAQDKNNALQKIVDQVKANRVAFKKAFLAADFCAIKDAMQKPLHLYTSPLHAIMYKAQHGTDLLPSMNMDAH